MLMTVGKTWLVLCVAVAVVACGVLPVASGLPDSVVDALARAPFHVDAESLLSPPGELVMDVHNEYPWLNAEEAEAVASLMFNRKLLAPEEEEAAVAPTEAMPSLSAAINCPRLTPRAPPADVGSVKPVDIVAMGAIGDSYTTASNAKSSNWLNMKWYPGLSWAMGADADTVTAFNIMRAVARPDVAGGSIGVGDASSNMFNNRAVGGAIVQDMVAQANELVATFKSSMNTTQYVNGWKTINVFIGGNNLCKVCDSYSSNSPPVYEDNLRAALNVLATIPRSIVSVVPILDGTQLRHFPGPLNKIALGIVCPCFAGTNSDKIAATQKAINEYNDIMASLVDEFNAKTGADQAFVIQPFLVGFELPSGNAGKAYLCTADSFHPSPLGHALFGTGLWNNMIEPVGAKSRLSTSTTIKCPTDADFIYTPKST